jgi:6-phosphogluconolactonase/glucosamine-6-phosphate isomerase/deaminase
MTSELSMEVLETPDAVAARAAHTIAALATEAIEARGRFLFAVSGGRSVTTCGVSSTATTGP